MQDVSLGQHSFRIRDIDAGDGSFLALKLINKLRKIMSESGDTQAPEDMPEVDKEEAIRGTINLILMNLDEDEFKMFQKKALSLVDMYEMVGEQNTALPIMRNGVVITPALKGNITLLIQLTNESLYQNLSPFFSENGLKVVMTGKA